MGKNNPKVSIVVPTYNRVNYLKECLESIINQNYANLEIIVSDDNSTDNTEEMVKEYIKKHPFIKYVKNKKYPKGPNGNKNNGLDYAIGEIIGIFDDDDIMLNGAINLMVEKIRESYDIVVGNCIRSDNNEFSGKGFKKSQEIKYQDYLCGKMSGEFWSLFKKEVLGNKRFDTDIYGGESTLWRGLFKNKRIYYIHKAVRWYRIHSESVIHQNIYNAKKLIINYERDIEYYGKEMKEYCPCYLATIYKGAAYFAKLSGNLKKAFDYVNKSIKLCPSYKGAYVMFIVNFLPKQIIPFLTKIRVNLKKIGI